MQRAFRLREVGQQEIKEFPSCLVVCPTERKEEMPYEHYTARMDVIVEAWLKDYTDLDTDLSLLIADIMQALSLDPQRGGDAITTHFRSVSRIVDEAIKPYAVASFDIEIHYRHEWANPYRAK
jgi:hypothetical protein